MIGARTDVMTGAIVETIEETTSDAVMVSLQTSYYKRLRKLHGWAG